jgi:serine/threonine protein kinase
MLDLTLPPDQLERCERHLESCPACQQRLHRDEDGDEDLLRLARQLGDPTIAPPDPSRDHILQRLQENRRAEAGTAGEPPDLYFLRPTDRPGLLGMLGEYEVQKVIGQGGFGVVLKAYEPALHRLVAIKVLSPTLAGSATARRRFTREAKAAAAVCHDHIVAVHAVHEAEGLPYFVMQYVAGESLQACLDRTGPLEVAEVVRIGMQTASGLAAAHAQGLIHRDIKPANLLLENGVARVKITDFGLARMADDVGLTQNGVVAGTPEYMAPEQARGETVDHRADLFSLGSVLYALCTGVPPFRASTTLGVLRRVTDEAPTPIRERNPEVPACLEAVVLRLLMKDPAQRFQSASEVTGLLEAYLAHLRQPAVVPTPEIPSPLAARSPGPPTHAAVQRLRQRLGLAALVLVASLGLGMVFWFAAGGAGGTDPTAGGAGAAGPPELNAGFLQDLRSADLSHSLLRPMGEGVSLEAEGVRIKLPAGQGMPGAGLATNAEVHGDFEITGSFEILKADRPDVGYGVGVSLFVAIDPNTNDAVTLARRLMPDGKTVFVSNRMTPVNGQLRHKVKTVPSTAAAGRLRIQRVGPKVRFLVAEGNQVDYVQVDEVEFPTEDVRFVQFGGNTGRSASALDVRLLNFALRAERVAGAAGPRPDVPAEDAPAGGKGWLAAGVLVGLLLALVVGLGVWLHARQSSRAGLPTARSPGPDKAQPDTASASFPFRCSRCGKGLLARAALAGKKVKCPQCRQVVPVPGTQTSEGGGNSP